MPLSLSRAQLDVERRIGRVLDEDLVHRYAHLNQPLSQIADDYGVTKATVSRWLKDAGVVVRGRGRRPTDPASLTPVALENPS